MASAGKIEIPIELKIDPAQVNEMMAAYHDMLADALETAARGIRATAIAFRKPPKKARMTPNKKLPDSGHSE